MIKFLVGEYMDKAFKCCYSPFASEHANEKGCDFLRKIALLGSTGSIGKQTLDVVRANPDKFQITSLAVQSNTRLLHEQINEFGPLHAVISDKIAGERFKADYNGSCNILVGEEHLQDLAVSLDTDVLLTALVGFTGLRPTIAGIKAGKTIALANKETLVAAGKLVMQLSKEHQVDILPVDSEHSAILQSMQGQKHEWIRKIILTASGGPFRTRSIQDLQNVSIEECLQHPNWNMGRKITVDSASLANKGLEVIEARWLFNTSYQDIEVVVHPQSIIHSMVEYVDGSVIAQLGLPDMKLPIQYALTYPQRIKADFGRLDFMKYSNLTFEQPDTDKFPCLKLAYQAGLSDGIMPCVFNAANEIAVEYCLNSQLKFIDIPVVIEHVLSKTENIKYYSLEDIFAVDVESRIIAREYIERLSK